MSTNPFQLGGTPETRIYDIEQSTRMLKLRIELAALAKGAPEPLAGRCGQMLEAIYLRLPPVRVWLFAKRVRSWLCRQKGVTLVGADFDQQLKVLDKPEDVVAAGAS